MVNTLRTLLLALTAAGFMAATPVYSADLWDVYQLALKNDPTFATAQANYAAALEDKPIARAGYLPNLNLSANRTLNRSSGSQPFGFNSSGPIQGNFNSRDYTNNYSLTLTQPLFNWGAWEKIGRAHV